MPLPCGYWASNICLFYDESGKRSVRKLRLFHKHCTLPFDTPPVAVLRIFEFINQHRTLYHKSFENAIVFAKIFSNFFIYFSFCLFMGHPYTEKEERAPSILKRRLYFATRSLLQGAPAFINEAPKPTVMSARVVSSVSPER